MSVSSEIGRLREVILHRPGLELRRLTPANKTQLLFDELIWVEKAKQEHDMFAEVLRGRGVTVRLFADLVETVVTDDEVAAELIQRRATPETCGVELVDRVRGFLRDLEPRALATHLIGGLTVDEVPGAGDGFAGGLLGPTAFLVPPLPNSVFTRDPSAHLYGGRVLSPMYKPARQPERLLWRTMYAAHPELGGRPIWYGEGTHDYFPATVEGGDILVLSDRAIAVGVSERTSPIAVENLAARLFDAGEIDHVLAVELPMGRGTMHLDTVMTQVDRDAIVMWPRLGEVSRAFRIDPGGGAGPASGEGTMTVREEPDLVRALAAAIGVDELRVITTGEDEVASDREQWDDGNNTLAIAPGEVIAYERNVDTNRRLRAAGITVHEISSFELPRGRGGPRCMSCPVERESLT
ncbi:arginine deiminase [Euzebya tangerina]|uniref:arginine deiminase n=1 Tax=Euzebya tangerina TaxID=591198 RepID=UPI000E31087E|nr:arginine deiminase [Euzebya tangerina]